MGLARIVHDALYYAIHHFDHMFHKNKYLLPIVYFMMDWVALFSCVEEINGLSDIMWRYILPI